MKIRQITAATEGQIATATTALAGLGILLR